MSEAEGPPRPIGHPYRSWAISFASVSGAENGGNQLNTVRKITIEMLVMSTVGQFGQFCIPLNSDGHGTGAWREFAASEPKLQIRQRGVTLRLNLIPNTKKVRRSAS